MSILIKGMEMPQNADGCEVIVRIQPNGEVLDLHGFHIGATAIPVPDHGRLIDADALEDIQMERCDADDDFRIKERIAGRNGIRKRVLEAPTIIPADDESNCILKNKDDKVNAALAWPLPGEHIQFCGQDWIALGIEQDGLLVIKAEPLPEEMPFDKRGVTDWRKASVRRYLNGEYLKSLCCADNALIEFESDLTADDGSKDYGTCKDKVFLLSNALYRKYRNYIPKYDCWWWTLSPLSSVYTPYECGITSSGALSHSLAYNMYGLIPSLCLNLSSLESIFKWPGTR